MADLGLGKLAYDLTIQEEQLDKDIKKIDSKISAASTKWSKALNISPATNKAYLTNLKAENRVLREQAAQLNKLAADKAKFSVAGAKAASESIKFATKERIEVEKLNTAKARTAAVEARTALAREKANTSINNTTSAYKKQGLYLQNLNTLAASYVSIFAVARVANKIREVTGEFELQNKALAAILQNKEKADQLFNQVTDLALKSPFAIKELLTYTKQLAAYRIESESLIPTLTKLADVSAGLGVDMSRLILAYGQVKAASVLRGTELRQFTEAGIPLVQLLADKFSVLNSEVVTTNEVFDMIGNRMVSFKDVSDIFEDMTSQGGMFFEAQAVQAKTLAGMWNILGDAIDKAMFAIGTENMDVLKGAVQGATDLTREWQNVLSAIKVVVATYGVFTVAMKLSNNAMIKKKVATALLSVATKEAAVSQGLLTAAEAAYVPVAEKASIATQKLGLKLKSLATGNWVGLLITILASVGMAWYEMSENEKAAREAFDETIEPMLKQAESLEIIVNKLKDINTSEEERIKLMREAIEVSNGVVEANDSEAESIQKITDAINVKNAIVALKTTAFEGGDELGNLKDQQKCIQDELDKSSRKIQQSFLHFKQSLSDSNISEPIRNELESISNNVKDYPETIDRALASWNVLDSRITELRHQKALLSGEYTELANERRDAINEELDGLIAISDKFSDKKLLGGNIFSDFSTSTFKLDASMVKSTELTDKIRADVKLWAEEMALSSTTTAEKFENMVLAGLGLEELNIAPAETDLNAMQRTIQGIIDKTKVLQGITKEGFGSGAQIKSDQSTTDYFKSILGQQDKYKAKVLNLEKAEKTIHDSKIKRSDAEIAAAKRNIDNTKNLEALYVGLVKAFNLSENSGSGSKTLTNLKAQVKLLTDIKKAREELSKNLGKDETEAQIQNIFSGRAADLKVVIPITSDSTAFVKQLEELAKTADDLNTDAGRALGKALRATITSEQTDELVDNAKKSLKDVESEIKAYKGKVDFYNDILGITKDETLSFKLAFDTDTNGLDAILRKNIAELDQEIELGIGEDIVGKSFEDLFSEDEIKAAEERISKSKVTEIKKLYSQLSGIKDDDFKDELTRLVAVQKEFAGSEQQKLDIKAKYIKLREDLDSEYNNQSTDAKADALKKLNESEGLELSKVDAAILASTQAYKDLYSDMENYSVKKMKSIRDEWESILSQVEGQDAVKGKFVITVDGENIVRTEEEIENLRKKTIKLNDAIVNKNPFEKISDGFSKLFDEDKGNNAEGFSEIANGAIELVNMLAPLSDALMELGEATGDTGMQNFADDLKIAAEWAENLTNLVAGIASGDPEKILGSVVAITASLIKAEAAYQEAKRAFLADEIKMQREYVLLLLDEQAAFADGLSIFDVNQFGAAANEIGVLRDATAEYRKEILNLSDAEVKTGVKRKKILGVTVGKKDIYGQLLEEFPDIIEGYDGMLTAESKLNVNRAKAVLSTEKLNDETKATLEQLIALQEEIDAANEAIADYLGDVFGNLGTELSDSLVEAFREGTEASFDFADNVAATMETLATDIANSLVLTPYFKAYQDELEGIFTDDTLTGDEVFSKSSEAMKRFYDGLEDKQKEYTDFIKQEQDIAAESGIDIYSSQAEDLDSLAKGIQGVTEDTARRLEAIINSIREVNISDSSKMSALVAVVSAQSVIASQSITYLQGINNNTMAIKGALESVITNTASAGGSGLGVYIKG